MSSLEAKNQIIRAFKVDKFVLLECDNRRHSLIKASDQTINGDKAVDRKGGLYLCEKFKVVRLQFKYLLV